MFSLIKHHAGSPLYHHASSQSAGICEKWLGDTTFKFYQTLTPLQAGVKPLKKKFIFWSGAGWHGFPSMKDSNGDPVSHPSTLYLYARWVPQTTFGKIRMTSGCKLAHKVVYLCVRATTLRKVRKIAKYLLILDTFHKLGESIKSKYCYGTKNTN